jgi:hypothetical protein
LPAGRRRLPADGRKGGANERADPIARASEGVQMSDRIRIGVGLVAVVVAVVLFIVLRGGSSSSGDGFTLNGKSVSGDGTPTIKLQGGRPVGGVAQLRAASGDRIHFRVSSDIPGAVHVHGYDYEKPIKGGGSVSFDFPAKLQGGFDVELHHGGGEDTIAELKVEPG